MIAGDARTCQLQTFILTMHVIWVPGTIEIVRLSTRHLSASATNKLPRATRSCLAYSRICCLTLKATARETATDFPFIDSITQGQEHADCEKTSDPLSGGGCR